MGLSLEDIKNEFHGGPQVPTSTYPILKINNNQEDKKGFGNLTIQTREMGKDAEGNPKVISAVEDTGEKSMDLIVLKRRYYYSWFVKPKSGKGELKLCTSEFDDWNDVVYLLEGGKDIIHHGFWKRDIKPYLMKNYPQTKPDGSVGHPLKYQNVLYVCDEFGKIMKMYLSKTAIVGPDGGFTKGDAQQDSFQGWLEANDDKVPLQLKVSVGTSKEKSKMGEYYRFTFKTKGETLDVNKALEIRSDLDQDLWDYEKARFDQDALPVAGSISDEDEVVGND